MRAPERFATLGMLLAAGFAGCSSSGEGSDAAEDPGPPNPAIDAGGGSPGTGGANGKAGAASTGGAAGTAGKTGAGGVTGTGGAKGSGGATSTGGTTGSGGATGTGGATGSGGATGTGGTTKPPPPPDTCIQDNTCKPGTWVNVTPAGIDLSNSYGFGAVEVDPMRPQDLYAGSGDFGVFKSTNYGLTWTGIPKTTQCGGYIRIPANGTASPPRIYMSTMCAGTSFWRSDDGGVTFTGSDVSANTIPGSNDSFYAPSVDPYDTNHLIMAGHLVDLLVESTDGGKTWKTLPLDPGMKGGSVHALSFLDTGSAATSRTTFLCISTAYGPGTWRTESAGATWTKVSENTHSPGATQIYQPKSDPSVVYMAGTGTNVSPGGVFRSSDNGKTWHSVGKSTQAKIVFGTDKAVYSLYGAVAMTGNGCATPHSCWWPYQFQSVPQPGTGTWTSIDLPDSVSQGPTWAATTSDGNHSIVLTANYGAGLYRWVEP